MPIILLCFVIGCYLALPIETAPESQVVWVLELEGGMLIGAVIIGVVIGLVLRYRGARSNTASVKEV